MTRGSEAERLEREILRLSRDGDGRRRIEAARNVARFGGVRYLVALRRQLGRMRQQGKR